MFLEKYEKKGRGTSIARFKLKIIPPTLEYFNINLSLYVQLEMRLQNLSVVIKKHIGCIS